MINKEDLAALKRIVGDENCVDDKAHLLAYSYDATKMEYEPDAVVFPRDENVRNSGDELLFHK